MKIARRIISVVLVAMMLAVLFTGCVSTNKSDLITITVYSQLANYSGIQTGWSAALLADKFGVELNIIPDSTGTYETRVESGNLGDIVVWGANGDQYQNAVELGLLYDWEEDGLLDEYGSYIKEHMSNALESNRQISGDGTTIYGFGHNVAVSADDHEAFFYTWDVRWDLYKELGYPEVNDLDDLVELFKGMKEIEPLDEAGNPTYALEPWPDWDGNMVMYVKALATAYYGYDEMGMGLYDSHTGEFHSCLEENGPYLTALKFFNDLYQNDLINPDSMTCTYDQMSENLKNGGIFFSIFNYSGSDAYNSIEHLAEGKMMYTLLPTEASAPAYGMSTAGGNRVWSIGAKTEYPELCMEIINWLATPEGAMATWYGIQGLMWDYDEEGYIYFTELGKECNSDTSRDMSDVTWTSPTTGKVYQLAGSFNDGFIQINNTTWSSSAVNLDSPQGETYTSSTWKTELEGEVDPIMQDWRDYNNCLTRAEYLENTDYTVIYAANNYSESSQKEIKSTWEQCADCIKQYSWKAIYAKSDSEFDYYVSEMIRKCDAYGFQDCLDWCNNEAAYKFSLQENA